MRAANCTYAELSFSLNMMHVDPANDDKAPPIFLVRKEELSVTFRYTNGQEPVRYFGVPGNGYFGVKRPVPAVVGADISFRAEGVCWYVDSQFCGPLHDWKRAWGSPTASYYLGVVVFFVIWAAVLVSVARSFGMSFKRATRMHQQLLHGGGEEVATEEEESARSWRERKEAVCAVVARLSVRGVAVRLFLIMVPWAYFLAIFRTCWQCYDFEAATAHHVGRALGLASPDDVPPHINSYHVGFAAGGAPNLDASTCQDDLWASVANGVPFGADVDSMTGVRPSIMQGFSLHTPRSCLELDDLEALNVLYPDCEGAATTPICPKPARNLGWLRLIVFAIGPMVFALVIAMFVTYGAMMVGERTGASAAAAKAELAAKQPHASDDAGDAPMGASFSTTPRK